MKKIFLLVDGLYARSIVGITNYFILSILYLGLATIGEMIFSPVSKKVAANSFGHGNDSIGFAAWKTNYYLSDVIGGLFVEYLDENYQNLNIWSICMPLSMLIVVFIISYKFFTQKLSNNRMKC